MADDPAASPGAPGQRAAPGQPLAGKGAGSGAEPPAGRTDQARWREVERILGLMLNAEPARRPRLLDEACGGDADLRREVEDLLRHHELSEGFLSLPAADLARAILHEPAGEEREAPPAEGTRVGAYRITREIGRGGMGRVFLAERADGSFRLQVALKLLRPGLEGDEAERRFRAERQILAALEHPNIARLLDGGVTDRGAPFLAMEYVRGEPIDRYCDRLRLPVEERLRLFLIVCGAVQHAHGKLIIHRDLKPSNILVAEPAPGDGGGAQVKLLDFGIAKLLEDEDAAAGTPRTRTGARWLTPEYAAPEQVRGEPATTAVDVYQLGVVLYELLAGRRPFEGADHPLGVAGAVLEREPERPSTAVARTSGRRTPASPAGRDPDSISRARSTRPERLRRTLRGDLDAIVLRALRKEPALRYASVEALAGDVQRYLAGLPVAARRGTRAYRAHKFVARHRWAVAAVTLLVLLAAGYVVTLRVQAERVRAALGQARLETRKAEQVSEFMIGLFEAGGHANWGEDVTGREMLERGVARAEELDDQPELQAQLLETIGRTYRRLAAFGSARPLFERALAVRRRLHGEDHVDVGRSLHDLGALLRNMGEYASADSLLERAAAVRRRLLGPAHRDLALSLFELGKVAAVVGDVARADSLFGEALAIQRTLPAEHRRETAATLRELGLLHWRAGDAELAEPVFREALEIDRAVLGSDHPFVANDVNNLALVLLDRREYAAAEALFREAIAIDRRAMGTARLSASKLHNLGVALRAQGEHAEADSLLSLALEAARAEFPAGQPGIAPYMVGLARSRIALGRHAEAEALLRDALEIQRAAFQPGDWRIAETSGWLGESLAAQGRHAEAEPLARRSYEDLARARGTDDARTREAAARLAALYRALGRPAQADSFQAAARPRQEP